jgi:hypothetical protein
MGQGGTYQSPAKYRNIERQQFSQPAKEITNARPRGLRIWDITALCVRIQTCPKKFNERGVADTFFPAKR